MKLMAENSGFRVSTTGVEVKYADDGESTLRLCAKRIDNENDLYVLEIDFHCVAELVCKTINFYETNHNEYQLIAGEGQAPVLTGFYRVVDSQKLKSSNEIYDPSGALNLNHYLVTGGDSYFEIVATSYSLRASGN